MINSNMINVQTNGSYTKIPVDIIDDFNLDAHMLMVLIALLKMKNHDSNLCQGSYHTLIRESRCSKEMVTRTLKKLEKKNYIQIINSSQESFCLSISEQYCA